MPLLFSCNNVRFSRIEVQRNIVQQNLISNNVSTENYVVLQAIKHLNNSKHLQRVITAKRQYLYVAYDDIQMYLK